MIAPTESELRTFAVAIAQIAFLAGFVGGLAWSMVGGLLGVLADLGRAWQERRMRICQARMRHQHGPMLLPGLSCFGRGVVRRMHKARAAQGDLARACEGLDAVRD